MINNNSVGGSVVECSPATRATRVRFPADALLYLKYKKISCFNVAICFCKIDLKAELRLIELIQVNDTGKEMVLHLGRGNSLN
ncbi:hypothetical protein T4B_8710 [Trichinella pseudospiralis]|uniref:Uncharacterized protein n=2 Tax=Trichinella pseudospiralis TaxID=6337 RepID=A0A0V1K9K2_TRIPS|nr:hypothetical protein T4D_5471 [Trichinella pseudospiralis]KRZ33280.1 hypothetical protein T4B_8710 [Trichinella pseudospiralis]KRZ43907.1 hypothetical protein T4C_4022 [Trichinella pseudospiralis]